MTLARLALALALVAAAPAGAKSVCGSPEEIRAAQLRQFHYQLQVAALNCRGDDPSLPGKWSAYVHHHGATLSDNAKIMHGYFVRNGKGAAGFDRFNTVLTNRESVRVHETEGYCEINAPLFDRAVAASPAQLHHLAGEVIGKPLDMPACTEAAGADKPAEKKTPKKTAKAG
ncbi:MAG: heme utilization protein [Magnetospirillum sp.]|nr:heme utilization protein [Magnetospirillum sp.]